MLNQLSTLSTCNHPTPSLLSKTNSTCATPTRTPFLPFPPPTPATKDQFQCSCRYKLTQLANPACKFLLFTIQKEYINK